MLYSLLADLILILHFLFILFVVFGAMLVIKWRWTIWLHIPCVIWGVLIEINHWICPLTYQENDLRRLSGEAGYTGGFIQHYLMPIIYPAGLTVEIQLILATLVIIINLQLYYFIYKKSRK